MKKTTSLNPVECLAADDDIPTQHGDPQVPHDMPRIRLFGIDLDRLNMQQAIERIRGWLDQPRDKSRYVVTPNVQHTVMIQNNEAFRRAYRDAHLILADGFPIIVASRLLGRPLPERVAGSELVPALLDAIPKDRALRIFLFGAMPGVADQAAEVIKQTYPGVQIVGTHSPSFHFEKDNAEEQEIFQLFNQAQPELLIVGLGAPKQEIWVHSNYQRFPSKVTLCVGATIDFLAGKKSQAPVWMRRSGLEWIYRILSEPRRLAKRYAMDACVFPKLLWREWRG